MIMNVKGLMQVGWLTGDGWLFELYTISNISGLRGLRLCLCLSLWSAQTACINCAYHIWHLLLYLPTTLMLLTVLNKWWRSGAKWNILRDVLEWWFKTQILVKCLLGLCLVCCPSLCFLPDCWQLASQGSLVFIIPMKGLDEEGTERKRN